MNKIQEVVDLFESPISNDWSTSQSRTTGIAPKKERDKILVDFKKVVTELKKSKWNAYKFNTYEKDFYDVELEKDGGDEMTFNLGFVRVLLTGEIRAVLSFSVPNLILVGDVAQHLDPKYTSDLIKNVIVAVSKQSYLKEITKALILRKEMPIHQPNQLQALFKRLIL